MIVLDASVLANVIGDDGPDGRRARREVRAAGDLAAPDLVDPETVAVRASAGWPGRSLTTGSPAAVRDLEDLDLDRYPALRFMRRAWELRANVTPCDATYVALAEVLGCELWTAGQRLAKAPGPACAIRVLS